MRLLESSAPRRRARAGTLLSVAVHAALIGGAAVATTHAGIPADDGPPETTIYFDPPAPSPAPVTPAGPATGRPAGPPAPGVPIVAPTVPAIDLPPIPTTVGAVPDPSAGLAETFTRGLGPVGTGTSGGGGAPGGEPYEAHVVERAASLVAPVTPRYPESLRSAGVEGRAALRFVVDTLGRVERPSVRVIGASHPAFGEAARAAVTSMRFRPAEVGGRAVRQLVELPFEFRLQ